MENKSIENEKENIQLREQLAAMAEALGMFAWYWETQLIHLHGNSESGPDDKAWIDCFESESIHFRKAFDALCRFSPTPGKDIKSWITRALVAEKVNELIFTLLGESDAPCLLPPEKCKGGSCLSCEWQYWKNKAIAQLREEGIEIENA